MTPETAIGAALLTPLVGAALIAASARAPNLRETATLATAAVLFLLVMSLAGGVLAGERPALTLFEMMPGFTLRFEVEPLGMLFALTASGLWIVNSVYSIG